MASRLLRCLPLLAGVVSIAPASCKGIDDAPPSADHAVTSGACKVFSVITKEPLSAEELARHKDPIAQKLLLGEDCPETFDEISTKLARTDANDCANNEGVSTRLVNDSVFLTGKANRQFRGVMVRECDGRKNDFFVSLFGMSDGPQLPQTQTEVIGMDPTSGVFNFYVRETREQRWVFMGSSADAVTSGYECNEFGSCFPLAAKEARCWACHESGGLNMKELSSPWDSWNVNKPMPGRDEIFAKHGAQLGRPESGPELEERVVSGNARWNKTRLERLKEKGAAEVLRPLFCTLAVNLESAGFGAELTSIPAPFFVSRPFVDLPRPPRVAVDNADYVAALMRNGQQMTDGTRQLVGPNGPVVDTQTAFRFVVKGQIDTDYVNELVNAKIVDQDFVLNVAHIDFTRPVFSKTRCDLLHAAPRLTGADLTPEKIRAGFIANLQGADGAAGQLRRDLETPNSSDAHFIEILNLLDACRARPRADFLADALVYLSNTRRALRAHKIRVGGRDQGIIEFPETLPIDKLEPNDKAFDPVTCTLR